MAERELSPAWVGAQEDLERAGAPFGMEGLAEHRLSADYVRSNPNQWTTPIGALCWADFELYRSIMMNFEREELDDVWMPQVIAFLGVESQVGSDPGPDTTRAVIAILEGYTTSTTVAGSSGPEYQAAELNEAITLFKLFDYWGGEGTELFDALDRVASPEWAAAVRAGDGLSADVLAYADGMADAARKLLAGDHLRLTGYEFGPNLPGYGAFVELAKYDPNCLRAMIGDPPPPLPDIPGLSTTTTEVNATTTTVRSGSVRVSGNGLNGVLRLGLSGVGVGYSRAGGEGSLTDTTFRHGGVGYEVERLLWWPNGDGPPGCVPGRVAHRGGRRRLSCDHPRRGRQPGRIRVGHGRRDVSGRGRRFRVGHHLYAGVRNGVPGRAANRGPGRTRERETVGDIGCLGRGGWSGSGEVPRVDQTRHPGAGNGLVLQHSHVRDRSLLGHEGHGPLRG